jgi:hypothetical protein
MFSSHVPLGNWYTVETSTARVEAMRVEKLKRYFILAVKLIAGR